MSFPLPGFIQLYPTTRCNQSCDFCFNHPYSSPRDHPADLSYEKALTLAAILEGQGVGVIDLMGGEPTMLPWIADFAGTILNRGMRLNISTNGSNFEAISRICDLDPAGLTIGVSLEGSSDHLHNSVTKSSHFKTALNGLQALLHSGLDPLVKTVITRSTMNDVQNIIDLVGTLGVRRYYLIHLDVLSRDTSLLKKALAYRDFILFYEKIRRSNPGMEVFKVHASCFDKSSLPGGVRCAGGVRKVSVLPDGSVFPCNLFHRFGEFRLGNIFEDDFSAIWNNPLLERFRKYGENQCEVDGCSNRADCTGGCPAHGYYHHGDTERCDIRCSKPR